MVREHHLNRLPRDARVVSVHGERCWMSGGAYYRINPTGGFVLFQPTVEAAVIEQPAVETVEVDRLVCTVAQQPVVTTTTTTVVEEPIVEDETDDDAVVNVLPDDSQVVVINGERCWVHNGVYYRNSDHGFKVFHPYGKHVDHTAFRSVIR